MVLVDSILDSVAVVTPRWDLICLWPRTKAVIHSLISTKYITCIALSSPSNIHKCFPLPEGPLLFIFPAICNQSYNKITRLILRPPFSLLMMRRTKLPAVTSPVF